MSSAAYRTAHPRVCHWIRFINPRRVRTGLVLASLLAALLQPNSTRAHAFLVSSFPTAGARMRASPPVLRLQFTEAIATVGSDHLSLETAGGRSVSMGVVRLGAGGAQLVAALPRLPQGVYLVNWGVVSADDGHQTAGQFAFAVGNGRLPGVTSTTSAPTDWWGTLAEWILLLTLAVSAGVLVSAFIIWQPLRRGESWTVPRMPVKAALAIGSTAAAVVFLRLNNSAHSGRLDPNLVGQALGTRAGDLSLAAFALLALALVSSFAWVWRHTTLLAVLLASLATALRSHPAASASWWGGPAIAVHVMLAILWSGVLIQLVLVFWLHRKRIPRAIMIAVVRRYAGLALWTVVVVLVSGFLAALSEFTSIGELAATGYGLVLLVKAALVVVALLLALLGRMDILRRPVTPALGVRGLTWVEAGALVAVLAASALLSNVAPPFAAPPAHASAVSGLLGPPPLVGPSLTLAGKAGWLEVFLTAGGRQLTLRVATPNDEAPRGRDLHLQAERPGSSRRVDLFPRPCGAGCFTMRFRWSRGPTRLQLRVGTKEWSGGRLSFVVPWPPLPADGRLLKSVIARMREQPSLGLTERTSSSPGAFFTDTAQLSGRQFVAGEPYSAQVLLPGVRPLLGRGGLRQLILYLSGSEMWVHFCIDRLERIRREVIVDPGHLIERSFTYPRHR